MPYNGSGTFTLAQAAFVPNTPISSSAMNSDLSDIATNGLTNAVTKDGQTTITGPFKGANGSVGLPMYSFASDTDTGMYRHGANELGFSTAGTLAGYFDSAQKFFMLGAADVAGLLTAATATFSGVFTLSSTGYFIPPTGTTGQRPGSPVAAYTRYNSTTNQLEYYNATGWASLRAACDPPTASFKNLSIKVLTTTTVALAADSIITSDGTLAQNTAYSATINLGTNGAVNALDTGTIAVNQWYAIFAIIKADGTGAGGLASLSATAPTLPTGYTSKARVGWVRTINASATLYGTWQLGRRAQYVVGLAQTTVPPLLQNGVGASTFSTTSPTLISLSLAALVPPTADAVNINVSNNWTGSAIANVLLAPSQAYSGTNNGPLGANGMTYPVYLGGGSSAIQSAWITLESLAVSYAAGAAGGALNVLGWEDNI